MNGRSETLITRMVRIDMINYPHLVIIIPILHFVEKRNNLKLNSQLCVC